MIKMVQMMPVLAGQHEQVSVYESMSHFATVLNGKNKNVYFGTKKIKPVFNITLMNHFVVK